LRRLGGSVSRRRAGEAGLIALGTLALGISAAGSVGRATGVPVVPPVVVLAFCAGAAYAAISVSAQTALFENMPPAVRGRVFGVLASIVGASSLLPILIAGPLADAISAPVVIAITAVVVVVVALASVIAFGPHGANDPARSSR
jgi:MFS family permease